MTKVLFVGNLLEKSGWGNHCRHFIRSLKSVGGLDVVCRPVVLGQGGKVDSDIEDLIRKDSRNSDYLIQMVLPHHMMYQGGIKNFGIAITETTNLKYNTWLDHLNLMDEIWLPNSQKIDGVTKPQFTIPPPVNIDKYFNKYPKINIDGLEGRYIYYSICEYNKRKNVLGMIIAFYRTFRYEDMTALVIKINKHGMSPKDLSEQMNNELLGIQEASGLLGNFPPVVFITEYFTEDQICGLHKYGNCYVAPSYGEAVNYPLLDACGFSNYAISSNVAGPAYMKEKGLPVILVDGIIQPCFGAEKHFKGHNNLMENWFLTDLNSLSNAMQWTAFKFLNKSTNMYHFSYECVGEEIIERLFVE